MATNSEISNKIAQSADEFMRQLDRACDFIEGEFKDILAESCGEFFVDVVDRTPEDTGNARENWNISTSGNDGSVIPYVKNATPKNNIAIAESKKQVFLDSISTGDSYEEITVFNNADHIEYLEDGHSMQAPSGMVSLSLKDFARTLKEVASKSRSFK